jgi:single-strand DNA-binding protein
MKTTSGGTMVCNFTLAVDRKFKREGQPKADFLNYTAFGKTAEFISKWCHKGTKLDVQSTLQNNNYQNSEGKTIYRNTLFVESVEFAESKAASQRANANNNGSNAVPASNGSKDDFMNISGAIGEELPFDT